MRHNILVRVGLLFIGIAAALNSHAALRTFQFTGTVTGVQDFLRQINSSVTNGAPFAGSYTFDDSTSDSNPDPTVGDYRGTSEQVGVVVKVGTYVFRSNPTNVDFLVEAVNRETDHFVFHSYNNISSTGLPAEMISWQLDDPSGSVYSNDSLPVAPPNFAAYTFNLFRISGGFATDYIIDGQITSVRSAARTFNFRGVVEQFMDPSATLPVALTNGTPFEGFYIFNPDMPDTNPDSLVGDYWHTDGPAGITVKVGPYVFQTNPDQVNFLVEVARVHGIDNYLLRSYYNVSSVGVPVDHISWQLDDPTGTALNATGESLPFYPPNLNAFQSLFGLKIRGMGTSGYNIQGRVTEIEETSPSIPTRPDVTIAEAVEISFPTRLGYFYQVQSSLDLETWTITGASILGTGETVSAFVKKIPSRPAFYRAEIATKQ